MDKTRPSMPSDIKRVLRQEAGFGCCICGHPFIQYHHIIPWSEDQHFRPDDMMVLCPNCHHLCTVDAISRTEQRRHKARSKNIIDKMARGRLHVDAEKIIINLGGGKAINTPDLIVIRGEPILSARSEESTGQVLVSAKIQDKSGKLVAQVTNCMSGVPQ